jgi:hypothetical protein
MAVFKSFARCFIVRDHNGHALAYSITLRGSGADALRRAPRLGKGASFSTRLRI